MPDLGAAPENVQRVLPLHDLLHEVGHDMAHRQLDVATEDLHVSDRPTLTDTDAVEGTDDGVRKGVLAKSGAGEVLDGELLKAVRRPGWWDLELLPLS
jgi:sensor domain CHASE-containing protein